MDARWYRSETLQRSESRAEKLEASLSKAWDMQDRNPMTRAGSSPSNLFSVGNRSMSARFAPPRLLRSMDITPTAPCLAAVPRRAASGPQVFQLQHRRRPANRPIQRMWSLLICTSPGIVVCCTGSTTSLVALLSHFQPEGGTALMCWFPLRGSLTKHPAHHRTSDEDGQVEQPHGVALLPLSMSPNATTPSGNIYSLFSPGFTSMNAISTNI